MQLGRCPQSPSPSQRAGGRTLGRFSCSSVILCSTDQQRKTISRPQASGKWRRKAESRGLFTQVSPKNVDWMTFFNLFLSLFAIHTTWSKIRPKIYYLPYLVLVLIRLPLFGCMQWCEIFRTRKHCSYSFIHSGSGMNQLLLPSFFLPPPPFHQIDIVCVSLLFAPNVGPCRQRGSG